MGGTNDTASKPQVVAIILHMSKAAIVSSHVRQACAIASFAKPARAAYNRRILLSIGLELQILRTDE